MTLAGRFRLIRLVARGGVGEVWLAEEIDTHRRLALKFVTAGVAESADAVRLLRMEYETARPLVHPAIVRLYELVDSPPLCFLVMQFVEGANLGTLRGHGFRTVMSALLPVAEALEYAHRQGVVHRDLKPSNILCDENGRSFITDFGTGGGRGGGSLPGMSPQQLAGEAPAVSDDIYAFGALLYDLLAGQPLFHAEVTPQRIREETPALPAADLTGEPLPAALIKLLGSLLQKSPSQRPPTMGAVRAALEDILRDGSASATADAGVIRPLERDRQPGLAESRRGPVEPPPRLMTTRRSLPAMMVYGGLALLILLGIAVVFYLPALVPPGRQPVPPRVQTVPPPSAAASPTTSSSVISRELLDEVLGEFLRNDDELRKVGAQVWGGAEWTELRRLAGAGDEAYRRLELEPALLNYRNAVTLAKALLARAPEVLAEALRAGQAAIEAGDQAKAVAQFKIALAVDAANPQATRGLNRARKLDQLLALMSGASAAESAGQRAEALKLYRQAAALDADWSAATAGIARLEQVSARDTYETQMARGFAATAGKDLASARAAFEAALRVRPGDTDARAALGQIDADQKTDRLAALQSEAQALEQSERWREALQRHETALGMDANLQDARQGAERARQRADLDERLRKELGNADRFNDDTDFRRAQAVLGTARAIPNPGPALRAQITELDRLLKVAATPVGVTLQSDNLTEVTLYKVGRLGVFDSKRLELRPGAYTAVGSRPGFRDVRRNFRVVPGNETTPVVVRCEEPI